SQTIHIGNSEQALITPVAKRLASSARLDDWRTVDNRSFAESKPLIGMRAAELFIDEDLIIGVSECR
ncbi:MAG: hypothetical protein QF596_02570, partial [Acidimicrobiales bacterium]|nr:hypothetical protein [Acidimicrobiales bacterium]